jgi:MFS family permease
MLPIYASDLFGERSYEKVLGIFVSVNVTGYALGAPALNLCYDMFGTYKPMLIACAAIMALVTIILQFVISRAHKVREEVTSLVEKETITA